MAGTTPEDSQKTDASPPQSEGMNDAMMQAANEALKASEWQMHHADLTPEAKLPLNITQTTDPQDSNPTVDSGD